MRVTVELELEAKNVSEAVQSVVYALQETVPDVHVHTVEAREYQ